VGGSKAAGGPGRDWTPRRCFNPPQQAQTRTGGLAPTCSVVRRAGGAVGSECTNERGTRPTCPAKGGGGGRRSVPGSAGRGCPPLASRAGHLWVTQILLMEGGVAAQRWPRRPLFGRSACGGGCCPGVPSRHPKRKACALPVRRSGKPPHISLSEARPAAAGLLHTASFLMAAPPLGWCPPVGAVRQSGRSGRGFTASFKWKR